MRVLVIVFIAWCVCIFPQLGHASVYGYVPGYTDDISDEVSADPQEMVLMEKPSFLDGPDIHDKIFNHELTAEFLLRYQQTFGRTEEEENYFLTSKQGYYMTPSGLAATQRDQQRREFAEYMMKRLVEFHTENVMKNDPQFRKVYEVKQALSNVKLEVGPQIKFDMIYSFVGNFMNIKVTNPIANTRVTVSMDPGSLVPTAPHEVYVVAEKPITRTIRTESGFTLYDKALHFLVVKQLSAVASINITETIPAVGFRIDNSREMLSMAGFGYTF